MQAIVRPGFTTVYAVELLYASQPSIDEETFRRAVVSELPGSDIKPWYGTGFVVSHRNDVVPSRAGIQPSEAAITAGYAVSDRTKYSQLLGQSWQWREEATRRVAEVTHAVLVTDIGSFRLDPRRRLELFVGVVRAAHKASPIRAIAWHPAGKVQDPEQLDDLARAAVNARLFRDDGGSDRLIMDTLGLAAVGLPDVQLDFRGLDPNEVAVWLFDLSRYILDRGDVIADGHTVAGISTESKWRCRHEMALATPEREVIDVDPGPELSRRRRGSKTPLES